MVFYGKQVKFRTTSKKSKDIALCTLLPPKKTDNQLAILCDLFGIAKWPF